MLMLQKTPAGLTATSVLWSFQELLSGFCIRFVVPSTFSFKHFCFFINHTKVLVFALLVYLKKTKKKQLEPPSPRSPTVAVSNGIAHDFTSDLLDNGNSAVTSGNFFEVLTSSELYKNTKVKKLLSLLRSKTEIFDPGYGF